MLETFIFTMLSTFDKEIADISPEYLDHTISFLNRLQQQKIDKQAADIPEEGESHQQCILN